MSKTKSIWALVRADGTIAWQGYCGENDPEPEPGPAEVLIRTDRLVEPWQRIDPETGRVTTDTAARLAAIDAAHLADHGAEAIVRARLAKLAEAMTFAATGQPRDGLLGAEAALRKISLDEMAAMVIAAAARDRDLELERIRAKTLARSDPTE